MKQNSPEALCAFNDDRDCVHAIVETPKGSRNKFKWDERHELYKLSNVLPSGQYYPYDFGFIPSTLGDDGDPLDILLFMDEPAFAGCLIEARLIGVMEAKEDGERNDRLIGVAKESRVHKDIHDVQDLSERVLDELAKFFVSYHASQGVKFTVIGYRSRKRAITLVEEGEKRQPKHKKAS